MVEQGKQGPDLEARISADPAVQAEVEGKKLKEASFPNTNPLQRAWAVRTRARERRSHQNRNPKI